MTHATISMSDTELEDFSANNRGGFVQSAKMRTTVGYTIHPDGETFVILERDGVEVFRGHWPIEGEPIEPTTVGPAGPNWE